MDPNDAYELIVRAGDFSKANFGASEPPADLLEPLMEFNTKDFETSLIKASQSLRYANIQIATSRPAANNEELVLAIYAFDKIHSYFHGVAILMQVWIHRGIDTGPLVQSVALEMTFSELLNQFGATGRLTRELVHQAIAQTNRAKLVKTIAWTDNIKASRSPALN